MDGMSKLRDPSADVPEAGMLPRLCWEAWGVAAVLHWGIGAEQGSIHPLWHHAPPPSPIGRHCSPM